MIPRTLIRETRLPLAELVDDRDFARWLGYPRGADLPDDETVRARAVEARAWFDEYGSPWVMAWLTPIEALQNAVIHLLGGSLESAALSDRLRSAQATTVVIAAVSTGPEIDKEVAARWASDRPDEAYFLERYGVAVVDGARRWLGWALCDVYEPQGRAVLPYHSPGFSGWALEQQQPLFQLLQQAGELPGPLEVLESSALLPRLSMLAAYGVADKNAAVSAAQSSTCRACTHPGCSFRSAAP